MSINKRRHPRNPVVLRVDGADTSGRAWMSLAHDLSRGGLRLAHPTPVSVGDALTVTFLLPSGQPCKLPARVVRADESGCALEFLYDLPPSMLPEAAPKHDTSGGAPGSPFDARDWPFKPLLREDATARLAEHLLARWFGVSQRLANEPQEALGQILPTINLHLDADDMAHTCAMHLVELLSELDTPDALPSRELLPALELWHQQARALHAAMVERTTALAAMVEATAPQAILQIYQTLLTQERARVTPRPGKTADVSSLPR
jgi:hypothetical protein